ncbi:Asp23/Gls24 family envelope stress response protein [Pseudokineococcus basanitobsidens]|uniref:Asp23/Gls24 family envelope stress response protein n=1 Tax=Pseudokineococcus basanitobsidens TaxID=1926649 RepID=A0ABU8RFI0_9ACTN
MAEATATRGGRTSGAPSASWSDAAREQEQGSRGSLELADKVLVKIAQRAALEVVGVAPAGAATGRLGGMLGRGYPDADVEHAGTRASVTLEIATTWPHPAPQVAASVRDSVTRRLRELAAVDADSVAVHVAAVVQAPPPRQQERVR